MVMMVVDQVVDVFGTRRKAAAYEKVVDPFFRFSVRVWAGLCDVSGRNWGGWD